MTKWQELSPSNDRKMSDNNKGLCLIKLLAFVFKETVISTELFQSSVPSLPSFPHVFPSVSCKCETNWLSSSTYMSASIPIANFANPLLLGVLFDKIMH